jgi:Cu/Ag efflux pump CusA
VGVVPRSRDFGFSMIHVIFDTDADILSARRQAAERLATADMELPPGVQPFLAPESPATGQIFW